MKIRILIVDDEPLARQRVRFLLEHEPDAEIIAECADGLDAVEQIHTTKPDLVFLDVQMPGMDGFEVLRRLPKAVLSGTIVIFTTAFDQHALRAFEVHALDYLLKPFKHARFKEAIQRAREQIATRQASSVARGLLSMGGPPSQSPPQLTRLAIKLPGKVRFVEVAQIQSIEAAGKYAVVHTGKDSHVLRETMSALESSLPPQQFLRISRSAIVNIEQIKELQQMFEGENLVVLKNGKSYPTTRPIRELQRKLEFR